MTETDAERIDVSSLFDQLMLVLSAKSLPETQISLTTAAYLRIYRTEEDRDEKFQRLMEPNG